MSTIVRVRYGTWNSRRKRRRAGVGTFTPLLPEGSPTIFNGEGGEVFNGLPAFSELTISDQVLSFAFWSVKSNYSGSLVSSSNISPTINVINNDEIIVTAWYVALSGGPDGLTGFEIDAFDVNAGDFAEDDFIQSIIPDDSLTGSANSEGFVPTKDNQTVNATSTIHRLPFENWLTILGSSTTSGQALNLQVKTNGIAFAFYHVLVSNRPPRDFNVFESFFWVSPGVKVDGGGFGFGPNGPVPIGPWGDLIAKLLTTIAIISVSENMNKTLQLQATNLAISHLKSVAEGLRKNKQIGK
jgi:hypothetical protein